MNVRGQKPCYLTFHTIDYHKIKKGNTCLSLKIFILLCFNIFHFRAYNASRLYRELKLRGAIVHNKQIKVLPQESVFSTLHGVWNLSSDQGSLGTFVVTNIRLLWFADVNENFNISLPYLHVDSVSMFYFLTHFFNLFSNMKLINSVYKLYGKDEEKEENDIK